MKLKHFGDALDFWKGAMLSGLQSSKVLHYLSVGAMPTDQWKEPDWQIYARLLQVKDERVIRLSFERYKRAAYFKELKKCTIDCDIFLDPDTGVSTGSKGRQYLYPKDMTELLNGNNVVLVYQHAPRKGTLGSRIEKIVGTVRSCCGDVECLSYQASQVAMLFFSKSSSRLNGIKAYFDCLLKHRSQCRVKQHRPQMP